MCLIQGMNNVEQSPVPIITDQLCQGLQMGIRRIGLAKCRPTRILFLQFESSMICNRCQPPFKGPILMLWRFTKQLQHNLLNHILGKVIGTSQHACQSCQILSVEIHQTFPGGPIPPFCQIIFLPIVQSCKYLSCRHQSWIVLWFEISAHVLPIASRL